MVRRDHLSILMIFTPFKQHHCTFLSVVAHLLIKMFVSCWLVLKHCQNQWIHPTPYQKSSGRSFKFTSSGFKTVGGIFLDLVDCQVVKQTQAWLKSRDQYCSKAGNITAKNYSHFLFRTQNQSFEADEIGPITRRLSGVPHFRPVAFGKTNLLCFPSRFSIP